MSYESVWTMNKEEVERFASAAMSATIAHLIKDGIIEPEKASEWIDSHTMCCLTHKSVLDNISKLLGLSKDGNTTQKIQFRVLELDLPK